jgi:endonuclease YncB( thermonuclease family)
VRWLLLPAVLIAQAASSAETISGTVVSVVDGDTLTVEDASKQRHRVRLAGIDAPEPKQPFYLESARSLAALCHKRAAKVEWSTQDEKKRYLGTVTCDGKNANAEQLRRGMAWGSPKGSPPTAGLMELEGYARLRKIGLWADNKAVPPWEWATRGR